MNCAGEGGTLQQWQTRGTTWVPHLYIFGSILHWASLTSEAAKEFYDKDKSLAIAARADIINLAKCAKLFNQQQRKPALSLGPGHEAQQLRAQLLPIIFNVEIAAYKVGEPPRRYMERELEDWLQNHAS